MAQTLIAAFTTREDADLAVTELERSGYAAKDISIISRANKDEKAADMASSTAEGAVSGATTGGVIGGVAGLLAGAGILPALAGLMIGGPIAAALGATGIAATTVSGVVTGAVAGGLIGALTGLGVSEDTARYYDETVNAGGILLAVPVHTGEGPDARDILSRNHAQQISEVQNPA